MDDYHVVILDNIVDIPNHIRLGKGAIVPLISASEPMIKSLRKKYNQDKEALKITKKGKKFLFSFNGCNSCVETFYRP